MPGVCMAGMPAPAELCNNNLDDDCNGIINDGCTCIYVAPTGLDINSGAIAAPVRHIMIGVDIAQDAGISTVCVASGLACPSNYEYGADGGSESINMRNGISLLGGFNSST